MTENKRFCLLLHDMPYDNRKLWQIKDNQEERKTWDLDTIIYWLNKLNKENEELKSDNNRLVNETARIVAEHQRRVLDLIDDKIKELPTTTKYRDIHEDLRIFAQQVLYDLKEELFE